MLTAAGVRPASSIASKTVTAPRPRWLRFMLITVSRMARAIPAARNAANEEPYSTIRRSSRWYQTRCGIRGTSGWAPVAIEERQTGVNDGKVDVARTYWPCSARNVSVGARRSPTAASNTDGVSPSMTIRISGLVTCERAEPGVPLGRPSPQAGGERGGERRPPVAERGDPRERREHGRRPGDQGRSPESRAAAPQRPAHHLRRAER